MEADFDAETIRAHSLRFSAERFRDEFKQYVQARWREHAARVGGPGARALPPAIAMAVAPTKKQRDLAGAVAV